MADNNKISIDVEINATGQQQLNQYSKAFDNLRNSITNLSNPIAALDKDVSNLTDTVNKLNAQNDSVVGSITQIKNASDTASTIIDGFSAAIKFLRTGVLTLTEALTGGLTILIAFAPEIINLVTSFLKGKDAVNAMAKNLKNLNDVMKASNTDAASQITNLNLLYKSATDVNNSYADRLKSVKELKKEFPEHLKGIKDEDILNGNSKKTYQELTKSIFETARAKAALNKITEEASKILAADYQIEKIRNANYNEVKRKTEELAKQPAFYRGGRSGSELEIYKRESDERARIAIEEQNQIKKVTQDGIDFLIKFAGGANTIAKTLIDKSGNNGSKSHHINNKQKSQAENIERDNALKLQAMSIGFAQTIELEKDNYDKEKALLDDQLNEKLISEQQYQQQGQELQKKYHQNIGAQIQDFNAIELDSAIKTQNAIVQEKRKSLEQIAEDEKRYNQERKDFELQAAQQVSNAAFSILQNSIRSESSAKVKQLETQKTAELNNSSLTSSQKQAIEEKYKKKEAEEKIKAFKAEQRASILQAVINGALAITKVTAQTGVLGAFVIPGIIAETAIQVATIAAQKTPQYAKGGLHYKSDGKGALLPGYSHTDNTNAYLRSGEAVVVSEAMRDPWARNLVSAINVAYGGRDFSMSNPGRGYAIGGIFTDGGNSNRYYNQPMNDQKDLANTIAYQMINNFPPVYVDVKDINNQQNILAQTVNRVNL